MADYQPPALNIQQQDLRGKVAIVTGATKGIGRAISLDLATRGCSILGTYTSPQSAHNFDVLCHTIQDLYATLPPASTSTPSPTCPTLKGLAADITDLTSTAPILSAITTTFASKIDILVLNAAIIHIPRLGNASESDIQRSLIGNLQWPITLMEHLVQSHAFNTNSRVVLISSDRVRAPSPGSALFTATKAGLEALTRVWAIELPLTFPGTTVNAVSVGLTDTPGLRSYPEEAVDVVVKDRVPRVRVVEGGRMGFAEDVADVVGWLVGEKARWQTGSVVAANGGAEWVG